MTAAINQALEKLSESALCQWLRSESIQAAVPWVIARVGLIPNPASKAAALSLMALNLGCSFKPDLDPEFTDDSCWERAEPTFVQFYEEPYGQRPGEWTSSFTDYDGVYDTSRVFEILKFEGYVDIENPISGITSIYPVLVLRFWDDTVAEVTGGKGYDPEGQPPPKYFRMFANGSECLKPSPESVVPDPPPPITQYSAELNCNVQAVLNGFELEPDGTAKPIITYRSVGEGETKNDDPPELVSGCNWFGDLVYYGSDGSDPPRVYPLPPDPPRVPVPPNSGDCPDPCPDPEPEMVGASTYVMVAPCEKDAQGNNLEWERSLPAEQGLPAISNRLAALSDQVSQALAWKTPICNERPTLEGDWRTISFRSDSTSPYGNARLRKRFRYRSTSGLGLGEVVEHWKDFTYESGPVVVIHSGSSWGTPQVWASTADEGKRVIRHAAGEAGIDPDQVGRWTISGSDSARFGVSDTMRVDKRKGFWWITSRDGSDNRPTVAEASDP